MTPGHATHRYTARLTWAGSTAEGYDRYPRAHEATCAPDDARLRQLVDTAQRHCFVANSLTTEIRIEPVFRRISG